MTPKQVVRTELAIQFAYQFADQFADQFARLPSILWSLVGTR
jgi:hypothetical protein